MDHRAGERTGFLLAAAVAVLLSLPGFALTYAFDDYNFLASTQQFHAQLLAPDPHSVFYRPISRELYFAFLWLISPDNATGGHIINACLLAAIIILTGQLVSRLARPRAGVIAALLLSAFGPWPVLIAWVSGAQDLFALMFVLLALNLELRGRSVGALVAFIGAILSKETAITLAPALVMATWLRERSARATLGFAAQVAAVTALWAYANPGVRALAARHGAAPPGSYIGLEHGSGLGSLVRYLSVLFNLPLTGYPTKWPTELVWTLALAALPFVLALWLLRARGGQHDVPPQRIPKRDVVAFGVLVGLPPLALTSFVVQHWAPYYACFPAVGISIIAGTLLAGSSIPWVAGILCSYLVLGTWSRGIVLDPGFSTERNLAPAGKALIQLERNFKKVSPTLPPWALVYVSTMATGRQSIYVHVHYFQVLRIWYRDPTIQTLRPELRISSQSPEFLFGIEPDLNVFQIDTKTLLVRSANRLVLQRHYRSVLTSYAIGLASMGELDRAVEILVKLSPAGTADNVQDIRTAAMLLLSQGETRAATALLQGVPTLPINVSLQTVGLLLTVPSRGTVFDEPAIIAFGFSPQDPKILRVLVHGLLNLGYWDVTERLANRLLAVSPGDPQAVSALTEVHSHENEKTQRIMAPIPTFSFPE